MKHLWPRKIMNTILLRKKFLAWGPQRSLTNDTYFVISQYLTTASCPALTMFPSGSNGSFTLSAILSILKTTSTVHILCHCHTKNVWPFKFCHLKWQFWDRVPRGHKNKQIFSWLYMWDLGFPTCLDVSRWPYLTLKTSEKICLFLWPIGTEAHYRHVHHVHHVHCPRVCLQFGMKNIPSIKVTWWL